MIEDIIAVTDSLLNDKKLLRVHKTQHEKYESLAQKV